MSVKFAIPFSKTITAGFILFLLIFCIPYICIASSKIKITASFYPLAHFAEQVGGENVIVTNIMPPGSEPHEFEPTPGDLRKIYNSGLFIFNGAGIDPWAERLEADLKKDTVVINIIKLFSSITLSEREKNKHLNDMGNRSFDPHIWLDPLLAVKEVEIIRDALIKVDPGNEKTYRQNSSDYIMSINKLNKKYTAGLKTCRTRDIIVSHGAFGYMSSRYDLQTNSITGLSPEEEPSARKMVELAKLALRKNIKHFFYEQLASPKLAETLAREVSGETLVLDPLGGLTEKDINKGRTYISVMEDNLHNLRTAMDCN